jgi:hypothetical protein
VGGDGGGGGKGGEMAQTMYAHMNKQLEKINTEKKINVHKNSFCFFSGTGV